MDLSSLKALLKEAPRGLHFYLIGEKNGDKVLDFDENKSNNTTLFVTAPNKKIINLNHVVRVKPIGEARATNIS